MTRSRFEQAIAVITGGANGLGKALALELAKRKAAVVVVVDQDEDSALRTAREIEELGGGSQAIACDVTVESDVSNVIRKVLDDHGRIDLMINNAGVIYQGAAHHQTLDQARKTVAVNFWGVYHGTMIAYEAMRKTRSGTILNVASIAGLMPFPRAATYSATKHAVVGFSTSLRVEAANQGIDVAVACPGYIRTRFLTSHLDRSGAVKERAPLFERFMMDPSDAARRIIKGLEKRRGIIIVPFYPRLFRGVRSLAPNLYDYAASGIVRLIEYRTRRI